MERDIGLEIARRIQRYREQQGMSQMKLADEADLNSTYIGQIERGEKIPSVGVLYRIADTLGMTLSDFFTGIEKTGITDKPDDYALRCYKLIGTLPVKQQERMLTVVEKITDYIRDN